MEVKTVPGYKCGSTYYTCAVARGFFFRVNKTTTGKKYLVCVQKNCSAKACCDVNDQMFFKLDETHNHLADVDREGALLLKNTVVQNAIASSEDLKAIFVRHSARTPVNAASKLAFPSTSQTMRRQRRKIQPPMPNSLQEFGEICYSNIRYGQIDGEMFCRGVAGEGDNLSVIFIAEGLLHLLAEAKEVHIDGTFKTRPRDPDNSQLLTIMVVHYGLAFPCVFALMGSRKIEAYNALFEKIKEIAPQFKPQLIMTDYEAALIRSLRRVFPEAHKTGCFFHYCQAILRKAVGLQMRELLNDNRFAKKALKMLMCLALLPSDMINEGVLYVSNFLNENNVQEGFETLLRYHQRQWIQKVGADAISVYKRTRRTNNDCESFHSTLQRLLKIRGPNIWEFTDGIRDISAITVRELRSFVDEGLQIRSLTKRRYRINDRRIKEATTRLEENTNVGEFLTTVSYSVETLFQNRIADGEEMQEDVEYMLAPLGGGLPPGFQVIAETTNLADADAEAEEAAEDEAAEEETVEEETVEEEVVAPAAAQVAQSLCMVCTDKPPTNLLSPCNHFGFCDECREQYEIRNAEDQRPDPEWGYVIDYNTCPVCRQTIQSFARLRFT